MRERKKNSFSPERTLAWAKWDVWFNGTVALIYVMLSAWQWWRAVNDGPLFWISLVIYLVITWYFGRAARKALNRYIEIKERQ